MKRLSQCKYNVHDIVNKLYRTIPLVPVGNLMLDIAQDIQSGLYNDCGDPNTNWQAWMDRAKQILSERNVINIMDNRDYINALPIDKPDCKYIRESRLKKINNKNKKIFLGGTCAESTWRDRLIKLLKIEYFNPVVDDWNEEAQKKEIYEREHDDFCLYTITPLMEGTYSIAEIIDDSNKQPKKTIFCLLKEDDGKSFSEGQWKSLEQVARMAKENGAQVFYNLEDVAKFVNN